MRAFADRLLGSNEVFSTFGLGNSLAGFLVVHWSWRWR